MNILFLLQNLQIIFLLGGGIGKQETYPLVYDIIYYIYL